MNNGELIVKVHAAMYHQWQNRGYAARVDVLMDIGVLPKQKYEDWRFGRAPLSGGGHINHIECPDIGLWQ